MSGGASCALPPVPLLSPPTCTCTVPSHLSLEQPWEQEGGGVCVQLCLSWGTEER